jgi:formylmethanofuran dehydrogenase subunit B
VRGDNDATLVLGADPGATMPQPAIEHPAENADHRSRSEGHAHERLARVHFTTAVSGVSAPGTRYRMDEIPMPLRPGAQIAVRARTKRIVNLLIAAVAKKPGFRLSRARNGWNSRRTKQKVFADHTFTRLPVA